ncbi:uncharacterized protein METZ01_LOCUS230953, partial [marine metagenome]
MKPTSLTTEKEFNHRGKEYQIKSVLRF